MAIWITMLLTDLLIPALMVFFGAWSRKGGPKRINPIFGYRTAMSMKNEDTWAFAHREIGRLWMKWGLIAAAAAVVLMLPFFGRSEEAIGAAGVFICLFELVPLIGCVVPVENALNRTFDKDGNRK